MAIPVHPTKVRPYTAQDPGGEFPEMGCHDMSPWTSAQEAVGVGLNRPHRGAAPDELNQGSLEVFQNTMREVSLRNYCHEDEPQHGLWLRMTTRRGLLGE